MRIMPRKFGGLLDVNTLEKCVNTLTNVQDKYAQERRTFVSEINKLRNVIASSKYINELQKIEEQDEEITRTQTQTFFDAVWDYLEFVVKIAREFNGEDLTAGLSFVTRQLLQSRGTFMNRLSQPIYNVMYDPNAKNTQKIGVTSNEEMEEVLNKIAQSQRRRSETLREYMPAFRDNGLPQDVQDSIYDIIKQGINKLDETDEQQSEAIQRFAKSVRDAWNQIKNAMKNGVSSGNTTNMIS